MLNISSLIVARHRRLDRIWPLCKIIPGIIIAKYGQSPLDLVSD